MATLVKEAKYILSNIGNNNNKFWYIELYDDCSTITRNGRVGATGATHPKHHSSQYAAESFFGKKCSEKEAKGYEPLNVIGQVNEGRTIAPVSNVGAIARKQIRTNKSIVGRLIDYFTKVNAHHITSATGGQITYSNETGLFSTPLGIVTQSNINEANNLLVQIGNKVAASEYDYEIERLTNKYMMLVPQNVGMRRVNVRDLWRNLAAVQRQKSIVDSLEASLVQATKPVAPVQDDTTKDEEQIFDVQLDIVEDKSIIDEVKALYNGSKNSVHDCSHLKVKTVYAVRISSEEAAFESKGKTLGNIKRLWHGTRASNVLSILKQGLVIPPESSSHCTGRAFGDGLYFSDQSTKSLNYSYGYWDRGSRDSNCFMFLCQVAMGREHKPTTRDWGKHYPVSGFDSTFAEAGTRFLNNEMIVYNTYQCNLQYLVEFSD